VTLLPHLPGPLRRTLLSRAFERRGPWMTGFEIGGDWYGGEYDYRGDGRLSLFFERFPQPGRVLELGSFEGGHSFLLAEREEEVLAVEVRKESIERARFVQRLLGVRNVTFLQADLEKEPVSAFGQFETIFCSGVVYHLPRPWVLLRELGKTAPRLWLWTLHAREAEAEQDGWEGSWWTEGGLSDPLSGVSPRSFWLTLEGLEQALRDGGYSNIEIIAQEETEHGPAVTIAARTALGT
jgi:SAM-dependent methyltransferase